MNNPVTDHDLRQIFTAIALFKLASPNSNSAEHLGQFAARTAAAAVEELNKLKELP